MSATIRHHSHYDFVRDTSIAAFEEIKRQGILSRNQERVLELIALKPDRTDRELAKLYEETWGGDDPNIVRPRRFELFELGVIVESGRRVCTVSGHTAYTWRVGSKKREPELF